MARLITAALDPIRADPACFVNREELVSELVELLEVYALSPNPSLRVVLVGEKGIGKTIASRRAVSALQERLEGGLVVVELEGRGGGYRGSLKQLARGLATEGSAWLRAFPDRDAREAGQPSLARLLEEVGRLGMADTITEADSQSIARSYGADAGIEGGLFGLLQGRSLFRWTETRQSGTGITRSFSVTDELLHGAIRELLATFALRGIPVLLFFNDLDQTLPREDPDALRAGLGRLVELEPCLQIVNVRPEVLYDDLRRESQTLEVGPMTAEDLVRLYQERSAGEQREQERARLLDPRVASLAMELARVNGNPHAFLQWLEQALRLAWPPEALTREYADRVVARVCPLPDKDLLRRAAVVVDRCSSGPRDWCMREDLERGHVKTAYGEDGTRLSGREIDQLMQYGILVPRDVFLPERGLRLDPVLDLLRPSVRRQGER